MSTIAPAANNQTISYLVEMTGSLPSAWSLALCSDYADVRDSNVQTHQPRVTDIRDIVDDNGGFVTSAFTVSVPGVLIATIDGEDTAFTNFTEFLQAVSLPRARVTITRRARTRSLVAETELVVAEISSVLESTPSTVTLAYNVSDLIEGRKVPKRRIADNQLPAVFARRIPEKVKGRAAPFSVGRPRRHYPASVDVGITRESEILLHKYGFAPRGFDATQVQNDGIERRYTWAEHADLQTPDRNTILREVFKYEGQVGAYAWIYDKDHQILGHDAYQFPWEGKFHGFTTPGKIWASVPVICQEVHPDSNGLSNEERATNTKIEEWATLEDRGDVAFFNLPDVPSLGRIAQNHNEGGGAGTENREVNAPSGISLFVIYRPPILEIRRMATAYLTWPEANTSLFSPNGAVGVGVNEPNNFWIEGTQLYVAILEYYPSAWLGTKFERWDFSAETEDEESALYNAINDTASGQFRLGISRANPFDTGEGELGIVWCGLRVGYLANEFDIDRKTERNPKAFNIGGRRQRDKRGKKIPTHITTETVISATDLGEKLLVFADGYEDDASGTYTGTANKVLENPAEYLRYIVSSNQYGTSGTITSGFGSFNEAATRFNKWVQWAGGSTWKGWSQIDRDQIDIGRPVVDALFDGFPETYFSRKDKFRLHVWIPDSARWTSGGQVRNTPIEIMDDLIATAEGVDFSPQSDWSNVVNEFEVHYDIDPESGEKRVASVDATGSDDGYGNPWPATPLGVDAHELAFWSRQRYGLRVRRDPIRLHGVSDPHTALACACHELWKNYREEITVPFPATFALHDLEFFKIVQLTDSLETYFNMKPPFWGEGVSWSDLYWLVMSRSEEEIRDGVRGVRLRLRWMPDSVGSEILGGGGTGLAGPVAGGGFVGEIGGTLGEPQLVETP